MDVHRRLDDVGVEIVDEVVAGARLLGHRDRMRARGTEVGADRAGRGGHDGGVDRGLTDPLRADADGG